MCSIRASPGLALGLFKSYLVNSNIYLESISLNCISIISSRFISLIHSCLFFVMSKSDDVIKDYAIDSLFGEGLFVRMDSEATKLLEHPWLRKD